MIFALVALAMWLQHKRQTQMIEKMQRPSGELDSPLNPHPHKNTPVYCSNCGHHCLRASNCDDDGDDDDDSDDGDTSYTSDDTFDDGDDDADTFSIASFSRKIDSLRR
jgi:hypothetical protein